MLRRSVIRFIAAALWLALASSAFGPALAAETLRVMTFNIWRGGDTAFVRCRRSSPRQRLEGHLCAFVL